MLVGFDHPGQHQLPEHLITLGRGVEPERGIGAGQGIPQMFHPRAGDLQRPARGRAVIQPEIQLLLPSSQPLTRDGLERLQLGVVVRGSDVLDLPRPAARGVHDLHRAGT
ncbi:hypothetical protein Q9G87_54835 [Nonomuraea sp. G32]|nr:hypothetical protein [Nonomuraea sp. G32]MDP4511101.1 hypothetical protein [Nonomuraea sp. G32]